MSAINLNRLSYFAAVADSGSFTAAADRLGITKAVVSQQVTRLEAELKTTLLVRTTRRVTLTEAGRLFHARCLMVLAEAQDAIQEIAEANAQPSGVLRIAAPNDYGARVVAPVAARFSLRYPACTVDLMLSDTKTDLIRDQIDLSIRAGWLTDSSLQARKIGSFRQWLVASPELSRTIQVSGPDDLASHPFIANGAFREPLVWHFSRDDFERRTVRMTEAIRIDSTPAILEATIAGAVSRYCRISWPRPRCAWDSSRICCPIGRCPPAASTWSIHPPAFVRRRSRPSSPCWSNTCATRPRRHSGRAPPPDRRSLGQSLPPSRQAAPGWRMLSRADSRRRVWSFRWRSR